MICDLNGEVVELPSDLLQSESIFRSVVSEETWQILNEEDRIQLLKYLPSDHDIEEEEDTIRSIFRSDKKFGNPISLAYEKLRDGHLAPNVLKMKNKCTKLKHKNYKMKQKIYYKNLLQEILISRQLALEKIHRSGANGVIPKRPVIRDGEKPMDPTVEKKFKKILKDIALDCGDDDVSSDEEYFAGKEQKTMINDTKDNDFNDDEFDAIFKKHKNRRFLKEYHPELDTTNISIADVILRCSSHKKPVNIKGSLKKKKSRKKDISNINKNPSSAVSLNKSKGKEPNKDSGKDTNKGSGKEANRSSGKEANKSSGKEASRISGKEKKDKTKSEGSKEVSMPSSAPKVTSKSQGFPKMSSFFSLLGFFFENEGEKKCSIEKIQEQLASWQKHKSSELCGWKTLYANWLPLVKYAIDYLVGKGSGQQLQEFIPYLIPDGGNEWIWTGPEYTNDDVILPLCNHWLETLSRVLTKKKEDTPLKKEKEGFPNVNSSISTTPSRYLSTIRVSTDKEREEYRKQEKERYKNAHKSYVYKTSRDDGSPPEATVGPVKGVFNVSDTTTFKAREHTMLVSDRPAFVTILCLVRDAVARLPNGEGTRVDICTLLRDSQFLNNETSDTQIHGVVSGALDRLHAEKDPCVKFDGVQKVWIYLHKTRTYEEFEKIHQASAAAALAKKQLSKKAQKKRNSLTEVSKDDSDKIITTKKKPKLSSSSSSDASVKKSETTDSTVVTTPSKAASDKKKPTKRRKISNETPTSPLETPNKQPKLFEEPTIPSDIQLSLENEALMATQSILDHDDSTDFFIETTPTPLDITSIANEILAETSFENYLKDTSNSSNSGNHLHSATESFTPSALFTKPNIVEKPKPVVTTASHVITFPTTVATSTSIPNKPQLKFRVPSTNKNVLQASAAKQINLPSLFLKTSNNITTASPGSFVVKPNSAVNVNVKPPTVQNKLLTQQQLAITNAILLQQQKQKQQQQQQKQSPQQQLPQQSMIQPQFLISTKALQGKQTVMSLQQIMNKKSPSTTTSKVEKQAPILNVKQITTNSKLNQPSHLGLTLGNLSAASLQNINQLISSTKRNSLTNTNNGVKPVPLVSTTLPVSLQSPSSTLPKQTVAVSPSAVKPNKTANYLWSPNQQSPTNIVQRFLPSCNSKPATQVKIVDKKSSTVVVSTKLSKTIQVSPKTMQTAPKAMQMSLKNMQGTSKTTQVTSKPIAAALKTVQATPKAMQTSVQTLSLNQLMAAARANLQPSTNIRVVPTSPSGQANATRPNSAGAATLQALLHVIPKSTSAVAASNKTQIFLQPQLSTNTGGEMPKVVRLPSSAVVGKVNNIPGVTLQRQNSTGQPVTPTDGVPVRARNLVAPLKITLPRTAFPANATVRMPVNTMGSPLNRTPANIVFSSPNMIVTGQNARFTVPKGNTEKK